VLYLRLQSMHSLNRTQTAIFTLLLHLLLPGDHITRIYLDQDDTDMARYFGSQLDFNCYLIALKHYERE